jgi:hypothetical protein
MATSLMLRQYTCQGVSCTIYVMCQQVLQPRYNLPSYLFKELQNIIIQLLTFSPIQNPTWDTSQRNYGSAKVKKVH